MSRSRWVGRLDPTKPAWRSPVPNIITSATGVFAQGSVRFLYTVIIAATMSASVLGELNTLISLAMLSSMLWPAAAAFAATKYVALARGAGEMDRAVAVAALLRRRVLAACVSLALPVGALAIILVHASWIRTIETVALLVAYSLYTFVRGVIYGAQQIPRATLWDVTSALIALGALGAVVVAHRPSMVLLPMIIGYGAYVAANWPHARRTAIDEAHQREIDRFVAYSVLGLLASAGLPQVAMVVAKVATGPTHAGQFAAALSLATPTAMLSSVATLVMFPALAEMLGRHQLDLARTHVDQITRILVATMIAAFGSLILLSRLMVAVFYPSGFEEAERLLPLLLVAVLIPTTAAGATTFLLVAHAHGQRIFALTNVSGFLLGIAGMTGLLIARTDTESVAIGYLLGACVVGLLPLVIVGRSPRRGRTGLVVKALAGGALVAAGRLVEGQLGPSPMLQVATTLAFLVIWCSMCLPELRCAVSIISGRGAITIAPCGGLNPRTEAPDT